jgi:UDP-glucose 4-epimerase
VKQRVLITGGAGFIGSHLAHQFLHAGADVSVLDNLSSGRRDAVPAGVHLWTLDVCSAAAAHLVRTARFDVICHLAAQVDVVTSVANPWQDCTVNVGGTLNLLEAVRESGAPTRFIFASSGGAVYGDGASIPTAETARKQPSSPYGISKLTAENYLAYYAMVHGVDTVTMRYANVYGPGQGNGGEGGVVSIFAQRVRDGRPLTIYGDGLQTRDYVYVGDLAEAHVRAASASLPPVTNLDDRAVNIGTGVETSVIALADLIAVITGRDVLRSYAPARAGELVRSAVDTTKARALLGWAPVTTLRQGLAVTIPSFLEAHRALKEVHAS